MWTLHPKLAADTHPIADWPLSRLLLMDDRRFPWLILVPRREGKSELHELEPRDRALLIEEAAGASRALAESFAADKINIAALGNQVPQLHLHVVARRKQDAAQPGLVWGAGPALRYEEAERRAILARLEAALAGTGEGP
jgi:diadenosine tetraphosphate (Ap4A) HIT family hydrolase